MVVSGSTSRQVFFEQMVRSTRRSIFNCCLGHHTHAAACVWLCFLKGFSTKRSCQKSIPLVRDVAICSQRVKNPLVNLWHMLATAVAVSKPAIATLLKCSSYLELVFHTPAPKDDQRMNTCLYPQSQCRSTSTWSPTSLRSLWCP